VAKRLSELSQFITFFGERRIEPSSCQCLDQANVLGPWSAYRLLLTKLFSTKSDTHSVPQKAEDQRDIDTAVSVCRPYSRLNITVAVVINIMDLFTLLLYLSNLLFLPARRYASTSLCDSDVSVRLSIRLSVTRRYCA